MPVITIQRKAFEDLVGEKLPTDKLKDRISYLGTGLEALDDKEITMEIFPNRPDLLSVQGFARAFSSFIGKKTGLRKYSVHESDKVVIIDHSVSTVRPYTACAIVKGINYSDEKIKEVIQLQEKLHITFGRNRKKVAIGIYPMEKIEFPITFLAKKPDEIKFQPLEFPRELTGTQILSQHPAGRDYAHLLEGKDRFPIFVDSNGQILSMPPIINSHITGKVSEDTKDVFIECSGFDFNVLTRCLSIIVTAMSDMGGKVYSLKLKYPDKTIVTPNLEPTMFPLDHRYINRRLGTDLNQIEVKRCLERMGFGFQKNKVLVPAYRADILHQIDFAEDVAIAYGYENFSPEIPNAATVGSVDKFESFKDKIADLLVGFGIQETNTYNLTSKEFQCDLMEAKFELIELANSMSKEYNVLRAWAIPSLFEVLKNNMHNEYPQRIFCFGTVFEKSPDEETGVKESDHLAVVFCSDSADYTHARQLFDYILSSTEVVATFHPEEHKSFISGRCAKVFLEGKNMGILGEVHPQVLRNWGLELPVIAVELDLQVLFQKAHHKK